MAITLEIPDTVVAALGLSQEDARRALEQDVALALYSRGVLSPKEAAGMLGINRMEFERLLYERQVVRSYSARDLEGDLDWLKTAASKV